MHNNTPQHFPQNIITNLSPHINNRILSIHTYSMLYTQSRRNSATHKFQPTPRDICRILRPIHHHPIHLISLKSDFCLLFLARSIAELPYIHYMFWVPHRLDSSHLSRDRHSSNLNQTRAQKTKVISIDAIAHPPPSILRAAHINNLLAHI